MILFILVLSLEVLPNFQLVHKVGKKGIRLLQSRLYFVLLVNFLRLNFASINQKFVGVRVAWQGKNCQEHIQKVCCLFCVIVSFKETQIVDKLFVGRDLVHLQILLPQKCEQHLLFLCQLINSQIVAKTSCKVVKILDCHAAKRRNIFNKSTNFGSFLMVQLEDVGAVWISLVMESFRL